MTERAKPVPDWLVERLHAGELPEAQANHVRARLEQAGQLSILQSLEASNAMILKAHPPEVVAAEVRRRLSRPSAGVAAATARAWQIPWSLLAAGATSAAVLVALLQPFDATHETARVRSGQSSATLERLHEAENTNDVRLKGLEPHLVIYKKTTHGALALHDGSLVAAGDIIQVAYVAAGYQYGVVASVDSTRAVTLHLPETRGAAMALNPQGETALPHAFELDATSGHERFVFVTSNQPFATAVVIDALHSEDSLRGEDSLPIGFTKTELSLKKSIP